MSKTAASGTMLYGGFGDAEGTQNGIIVDPLAFGSAIDPKSGGGPDSSPIDQEADNLADGLGASDLFCFIASTSLRFNERGHGGSRHEIRAQALMSLCIIFVLGIAVKANLAGAFRRCVEAGQVEQEIAFLRRKICKCGIAYRHRLHRNIYYRMRSLSMQIKKVKDMTVYSVFGFRMFQFAFIGIPPILQATDQGQHIVMDGIAGRDQQQGDKG